MISFIISVGAFVIGAIVIYYIAVIGLFLALAAVTSKTFWGIVGAVTIIIAIMVGVSSKASADSIDVGYMYYTNNKLIQDNYSVGGTKTINDLFEIKAGVFNDKSISLYLMGRVKHDTKNVNYGINFGFIKSHKGVIPYKLYEYEYNSETGTLKPVKQIGGGSTNASRGYIFAVMPTITFKANQHAVEFGYIPKIFGNEDERISIQYQYSL